MQFAHAILQTHARGTRIMKEFCAWCGLAEYSATGPSITSARGSHRAFSTIVKVPLSKQVVLITSMAEEDMALLVETLNIVLWRELVNLLPMTFVKHAVAEVRHETQLMPDMYVFLVQEALAFRLGMNVYAEPPHEAPAWPTREVSQEERYVLMQEETENLLWRVLRTDDGTDAAGSGWHAMYKRLLAQMQAHERVFCRPPSGELMTELKVRRPQLFEQAARAIIQDQRIVYTRALALFDNVGSGDVSFDWATQPLSVATR